jgi:3-methylfumaryl-CoA hydratase
VPLPRRMWAGSRFELHAPLCVGDTLTRVSTIHDVTEKSGRSGALVFVTVRHAIRRSDESAIALTEFHDIVDREAAKAGEVAAPPKPAPASAAWERRWAPDEVFLLRYSALTCNGHRIHYDRRYVTEVERYPGLVVHGPLVAALRLDLPRRRIPGAEVARSEFRAVRPLFDHNTFFVCGEPQGDGMTIRRWPKDHAGALTMDATAEIR